MAEAFTSYSVDNDKRFRNALRTASEGIQDFRVPFGQILRDFYKSEQAIFKLKGPGKYPPFKTSVTVTSLGGKKNALGRKRTVTTTNQSPYQRYKIKKYGFDYPLLVATGRLAASLLGPSNPGSVALVGKLSLIFGTSVPYAIYHQSDAARKKIPLRKMIFIGPEAPSFATSAQMGRLERWVGYVNDHMANAAIRSGLASRLPSGGGAS